MWIQHPDGFVSIVRDKAPGTNQLQVRARVRAQLARLFPGHRIIETPAGDYRYRVVVSHADAARVVGDLVLGIGYTNFKGESDARASRRGADDRKYASALHRVWSVFGDLQPGGPYGMHNRPQRPLFSSDPFAVGSGRREPLDEPELTCGDCGAELGDDDKAEGVCGWCGAELHGLDDDEHGAAAALDRNLFDDDGPASLAGLDLPRYAPRGYPWDRQSTNPEAAVGGGRKRRKRRSTRKTS